MKTLLTAAAAIVLAGMSFGTANADQYRHHAPGVRVIIGTEGPRMHRHHYPPKRCWTEKERFRDHHGRVHVRTVRVCR